MKGTSFDSIIVQKDTCIACALLKRKLLGYGGSMTDTTSLKTYLNDSFPLFTQTGNAWLSSLRNCKLLKEYVATGASEAFFEMGLGSSSEYHFGRGDISIEAWVNITDTINNKVIFSTETYSFSFGAMSGVSFLVHGSQPLLELCDGQQDVDLLGSTHLPINTWHHLVATRTGNYWTSWHIYVDGSSISVSDFTGFSYSGLYVTTNLVSGNIDTVGTTPYIGLNDGTSNKWPFIGDYRQVRLYNRVISSSEVTASYNGGCGGPPSDTSKLVMWCPLYEGGGYYGHDISRFNDYGDDWYGGSSPFVRNIDTTCFVNGTAVCKLVNVKKECYAAVGWNGKRKDQEIYNEGDMYDYGAREYDSRGPTFWGPDPLTRAYPYYSPYQFAGGTPFWAVDLDGLEPQEVIDKNGKLTAPVISLLKSAFDFSTSSLEGTSWVIGGVPTGNGAITIFQAVHYTQEWAQQGSILKWIPLVAHEQTHRDELGNDPYYGDLWYTAYLAGYVARGFSYENDPMEVRAFNNEASARNLPLAEIANVLRSKSSEEIKSLKLNVIGLKFKRSILEEKLKTQEKKLEDDKKPTSYEDPLWDYIQIDKTKDQLKDVSDKITNAEDKLSKKVKEEQNEQASGSASH